MHLVGFAIAIYCDARSYKRQTNLFVYNTFRLVKIMCVAVILYVTNITNLYLKSSICSAYVYLAVNSCCNPALYRVVTTYVYLAVNSCCNPALYTVVTTYFHVLQIILGPPGCRVLKKIPVSCFGGVPVSWLIE